MVKNLILLLAAVMAITACHPVHPHGCPPGQAKKGNCPPWIK